MKTQNLQQKNGVIDSKTWGVYSEDDPIKFLTKSIESSFCDYSDAYILVAGNIAIARSNNNTKVAFKNCAPFKNCRTEINETFIDEAEHINITMPMYNLIEYSDNYCDTSGSLRQFKRNEIEGNNDLMTMISQLMTRLSNTTKSEKYQQDKVMITQLVVY